MFKSSLCPSYTVFGPELGVRKGTGMDNSLSELDVSLFSCFTSAPSDIRIIFCLYEGFCNK